MIINLVVLFLISACCQVWKVSYIILYTWTFDWSVLNILNMFYFFPYATELQIQNNNFTGQIPASACALYGDLDVFNIDCNICDCCIEQGLKCESPDPSWIVNQKKLIHYDQNNFDIKTFSPVLIMSKSNVTFLSL